MIYDLAIGTNYNSLSQNLQERGVVAVRRAHNPKTARFMQVMRPQKSTFSLKHCEISNRSNDPEVMGLTSWMILANGLILILINRNCRTDFPGSSRRSRRRARSPV
jgi:hypothetical protein